MMERTEEWQNEGRREKEQRERERERETRMKESWKTEVDLQEWQNI